MGGRGMGEPAKPTNLAAVAEAVRDLADATRIVDRRLRQRTQLFTAVVVLFLLAVTVRTEIQQQQIRSNNARIEVLLYGQCVARRADVLRQNALIDSAIAAEKRKPAPDRKRIADLGDFRATVPVCGTPPGR